MESTIAASALLSQLFNHTANLLSGLVAVCLFVSFTPAASLAQGTVEADLIQRTFQVDEGGLLTIDSDRGSIQIKTGSSNAVQVAVHREADSPEVARRFKVTFEQQGDDVYIEGKMPDPDGDDWDLSDLWNAWNEDLRIRYVVTVPQRYNVSLHTAGGSISIDDLTGNVTAETAGGSLNFGQIQGDVRGETAGGSIDLAGAAGNVWLETAGGSIDIGTVEGEVEASTAGGSIDLAGATGNVWLETAGGSINVGEVGGNIEAETAGGSISLGEIEGTVDVETSGGSISVDGAGGRINAETSGGSITVHITDQPQEPSRLDTSSGDVTVYLADDVGVTVDAETSSGEVVTEFPVPERDEDERDTLHAEINGGGPSLDLSTSSGDIHIRSSER